MSPNFNKTLELFCGEKLTVLDSTLPAFSDCFESIVFAYIPFILLSMTSAYYIGKIRIPDLRLKPPRNYIIRQICTVSALLLTAANGFLTIFLQKEGHGYFTVTFSVVSLGLLVHWIYLYRLVKVHFLRGRGPVSVIISWIITLPHFIAYTEFMIAKTILEHPNHTVYIIQSTLAALSCAFQLVYLACLFVPSSRFRAISVETDFTSPDDDQEELLHEHQLSSPEFNQRQSPADHANIFSKLFFMWVQPLMRKGSERLLTSENEVFALPMDINTVTLDGKFSTCLKTITSEQRSSQNSTQHQETHTLLKAMHRTFGKIYYASGVLKLIADVLAFAGPLLLNKLVNYIENADEPVKHGYYYATGLFLSTLIGALLSVHFDYQVNKVKLRVKSALITNIYRKTLQAQPAKLSTYTSGEITNFMSTDVDRIVNFFASFHEFWSLPFQVAITLYLLYVQVGVVFLAGLGLAIIMIIFNRYLANKIGEYNAAMMKYKDNRVKLMTEILLGIRVIKFNAWEYFMSGKLGSIRKEEIRNLKGIKYFDAGCVYLWATTPVLISLLTFSIYSALGNDLTAAKVFTVIALINMLISPLNAFPWVINGLMEAWISLKRLNRFMLMDNLDLEKYYHFPTEIEPDDMDLVVSIESGNFSWSGSHKTTSDGDEIPSAGIDQELTDVSLKIREGQFIGVIGSVGSGKSSLLSAILAEMKRDEGQIYVDCVHDGVAIVNQEPWIQHATIRDNILWGMPYEVHRYESIVEACALKEDFNMFPNNDLTEVGENGVTLSGGQKARVALARAIYQDRSLYLLDDPLSAVDQHVASHLYYNCLIGKLSGKTRILCTHHTKYLRHADAVVVMENGAIKQIGTPDEVLNLSLSSDQKKQVVKVKVSQGANTRKIESISASPPAQNQEQRLMTEEEKAVGTVAFSVYKSYWNAIGTCLSINILVFLFLMQGSKVTSDWWLSFWVSHINSNTSGYLRFEIMNTSNLTGFTYRPHFVRPLALSVTSYTVLLSDIKTSLMTDDVKWYLMIYGSIAASNSVFTLFRSFLFAYGGIKAAKVLHKSLLSGVLKAPISFFDVTPVGRILNRFSSDTYTVDDSLPFILNIFLAQFVGVIGTIVITCYGLPWFSIALLPLGLFYFYIQYYYRLTSRELKRLSSISLSPIYAHFTESLSGLTTIRAFRKHEMFRSHNVALVTSNQRCNFSTLAAQEWFGVRLQMIGVAMVTVVAFVAVVMHEKHAVSPGLAGLALSYALSVTSRLAGVITSFTETEKQMVAVERESHYINNIPKERETEHVDPRIMGGWPVSGTVEFSDVSLRYREGLPLALRNVSFKIKSGKKIGVVGRTGSGKSSLLSLLFGMIEPCEGSILIDDVDIKRVPLRTLRSKLSIIPQDPFLFSGSLRENLVPSENDVYDNAHLMRILERCNLKDKVIEMGGLFTDVGERGKRLSLGQRQLLCLARALLTDSKIVCLDEATASVDSESDALLQKTIREQFKDRTVITIAHRISTITDCDKVIVMDDGRIAEFGKPDDLLQDSDSFFYKLTQASGAVNK